MERIALAALLLSLVLGTMPQAAGQRHEAGVLLQSGRVKEQIHGDVAGAIALYQQAIAAATTDRRVAAQASLALGLAYQALGRHDDARGVFDRVLRDFSDQAAVRVTATDRLRALGPMRARAQGVGTAPRLLVTSESVRYASISHDGGLAAGVVDLPGGGANLMLRNLFSGTETLLIAGSSSAAPGYPLLSPDGRQVAYLWFETVAGTIVKKTSIRIMATSAGATPRTLYAPENPDRIAGIGPSFPAAWSPDGKRLLFSFAHPAPGGIDMNWVSIDDGVVRTIKTFDRDTGAAPGSWRVSPGGEWITYDAPPSAGARDRRIYVVNAEGQSQNEVVRMIGNNTSPVWAPDGTRLLFTSTRSGTRALWSVPVFGGQAASEPTIVQAAFTGALWGFTASQDLLYSMTAGGESVVFVADRAAGTARVTHSFTAGLSPALSPDGTLVAFSKLPSRRPGSQDLAVRNLQTGEERLFQHDAVSPASRHWLPDGSGLVVFVGSEGDEGRAGGSFYVVDATTGTFRRLFARNTDDRMRSPTTALAPNGRTLYAVERERGAASWTTLIGIDVASGNARAVASFSGGGLPAGAEITAMAVNSDESTVAIQTVALPNSETRLVAVRTDGARDWVLHTFPVVNATPPSIAWTPDGQAVLFGDNRGGAWQVLRVSAAGGSPTLDSVDTSSLTGTIAMPRIRQGMAGGAVSLSADGSKIAFNANTPQAFQVWAMDVR